MKLAQLISTALTNLTLIGGISVSLLMSSILLPQQAISYTQWMSLSEAHEKLQQYNQALSRFEAQKAANVKGLADLRQLISTLNTKIQQDAKQLSTVKTALKNYQSKYGKDAKKKADETAYKNSIAKLNLFIKDAKSAITAMQSEEAAYEGDIKTINGNIAFYNELIVLLKQQMPTLAAREVKIHSLCDNKAQSVAAQYNGAIIPNSLLTGRALTKIEKGYLNDETVIYQCIKVKCMQKNGYDFVVNYTGHLCSIINKWVNY